MKEVDTQQFQIITISFLRTRNRKLEKEQGAEMKQRWTLAQRSVSVIWGTVLIGYGVGGNTKTANLRLSTSTLKTEGSRRQVNKENGGIRIMGFSIKGRWPSAERGLSELIDSFRSPQKDIIAYTATTCLSSCAPTWHAAWMAASQHPS
ncbi:hypothetical protein KCU62_g324, partial [Aureobasidium sp. EXF-3399]